MPQVPKGFSWNLENPGSRFTMRPALALPIPEQDWPYPFATSEALAPIVARDVGEWILNDDDELGRPRVLPGGFGRGAEGPMPVVEWLAEPAVKGMISAVAGAAALKLWKMARGRGDVSKADDPDPKSVYVSRGMAVLLAAAAVKDTFDDSGPHELEAVEEPSSIAGKPLHELNYVGLEPWMVFLLNRERLRRYVVAVGTRGDILGCMEMATSEYELMYIHPPDAT